MPGRGVRPFPFALHYQSNYLPRMNLTDRRKSRLADIALLYAAAIWGATFFVVKDSLATIDPVVLVGYRFLLAAAVLAIGLKIAKRPLFLYWKESTFLGIILWGLYISQTIGLKYTTASNSGFITGLFVAFVPFFTLMMNRKTRILPQMPAVLLSLLGLWLLTGGLTDINRGDWLTLIAAMTYAGHLLYVDRFVKQGLDVYILSFQQFLFVGLLSLLTAAVFRLPFVPTSTDAIGYVVFLALLPTLSAFVLQLIAQKVVPPIRVSLILALEPVFAALFAWTLGGEIFIPRRALGGLLIFVAMVLSDLPAFLDRRRKA
jgi:drug/metabolite transporter (DMT)-like permease